MGTSTVQHLKESIPWWFKIAAKLIVKRFPYPYSWSQKLGVLRHGHMLDIQYALDTFHLHYDQAKLYLPESFTTLELGPGDSLASALISAAFGSRRTWLVDADRFANMDSKVYSDFSKQLAKLNLIPAAVSYTSLGDMLQRTCADYLVDGLTSLGTIPDHSVNFAFSQAVLEHVYLTDVEETLRHLFRIQTPGGVASHRIDLKDHLASSLHSLRFSQWVWESKYFRTSGFYTNRLRASQWRDLFIRVGYRVLAQHDICFPVLPLARSKMQPEFARFPDDDLMVSSVQFILQK